jgi:hypothetical protein
VIGVLATVIAAKKTFPHLPRTRKTNAQFSPIECYELFRFENPDLIRLQAAQLIPATFSLSNRSVVSREEAMNIAFLRLSSPIRWLILLYIFAYTLAYLSAGFQSECLYLIVEHICNTFTVPLFGRIAKYGPYIDQRWLPLLQAKIAWDRSTAPHTSAFDRHDSSKR